MYYNSPAAPYEPKIFAGGRVVRLTSMSGPHRERDPNRVAQAPPIPSDRDVL
jgi:hypothetical protein